MTKEQDRRSILDELGKTAQAEQGIRDDNDFGGPAGSNVGIVRKLVGRVTAVFDNNGRPTYSAFAIDNPNITVTSQPPIGRETNSSVRIIAGLVGNVCEFLRDVDDVWRLYWVLGDVMDTDDCQAVAGSRSNMAVSFVTTTPVSALPITADLVVVHDTVSNVTLTLPESEVGKPIKVANASTTGHDVIITNIIFGVANTRIAPSEVFDMGYTGNNSIGWIL